jgi:hypothetical protein
MKDTLSKILAFLLIGACANPGTKPPSPASYEKLERLRNERLASIQEHQDEHGFIDTEHCDSLLFSGLLAYGGGDVSILAAERSPGEWLRRPTSYQECWENGESRSTISRDQLLGVMWATQAMEDEEALAILVPMYDYGKANNWIMGEGRLGGADTLMPPAYIALLADLLIARGYSPGDVRVWGTYPNTVDDKCSAYVCHVNVLRHYLRFLSGNSGLDREGLAAIANRYPQNAFFQYAAGRQYRAAELLLAQYGNHQAQPFCESYPMQENGGHTNWARCENGHDTGAGALFVLSLLLDK